MAHRFAASQLDQPQPINPVQRPGESTSSDSSVNDPPGSSVIDPSGFPDNHPEHVDHPTEGDKDLSEGTGSRNSALSALSQFHLLDLFAFQRSLPAESLSQQPEISDGNTRLLTESGPSASEDTFRAALREGGEEIDFPAPAYFLAAFTSFWPPILRAPLWGQAATLYALEPLCLFKYHQELVRLAHLARIPKMFRAGFDNEIFSRSARLFPEQKPIKCRYVVDGSYAHYDLFQAALGGCWLRERQALEELNHHISGKLYGGDASPDLEKIATLFYSGLEVPDFNLHTTSVNPVKFTTGKDEDWSANVGNHLAKPFSALNAFLMQSIINAKMEEAVTKGQHFHGARIQRNPDYASIIDRLEKAEGREKRGVSETTIAPSQALEVQPQAPPLSAQASEPVAGDSQASVQEQTQESTTTVSNEAHLSKNAKKNLKKKAKKAASKALLDNATERDEVNTSTGVQDVASSGKNTEAPVIRSSDLQLPKEVVKATLPATPEQHQDKSQTTHSVPQPEARSTIKNNTQKPKAITRNSTKESTNSPNNAKADHSLGKTSHLKEAGKEFQDETGPSSKGTDIVSSTEQTNESNVSSLVEEDDGPWSLVQSKPKGAHIPKASSGRPKVGKKLTGQASRKQPVATSKPSLEKAREFKVEDYPPMPSGHAKKATGETAKTAQPSVSTQESMTSEKKTLGIPAKSPSTLKQQLEMDLETKDLSVESIIDKAYSRSSTDLLYDDVSGDISRESEVANNVECIENTPDNESTGSENNVIVGDISWANLEVRHEINPYHLARRHSAALDLPREFSGRLRSLSMGDEDIYTQDTTDDVASLGLPTDADEIAVSTSTVYQSSDLDSLARSQTLITGASGRASVAALRPETTTSIQSMPSLTGSIRAEEDTPTQTGPSATSDYSQEVHSDIGHSVQAHQTYGTDTATAYRPPTPPGSRGPLPLQSGVSQYGPPHGGGYGLQQNDHHQYGQQQHGQQQHGQQQHGPQQHGQQQYSQQYGQQYGQQQYGHQYSHQQYGPQQYSQQQYGQQQYVHQQYGQYNSQQPLPPPYVHSPYGYPMVTDHAGTVVTFPRPQASIGNVSALSGSFGYHNQELRGPTGVDGGGKIGENTPKNGPSKPTKGNSKESSGAPNKKVPSERAYGGYEDHEQDKHCFYCQKILSKDDDLNFVCLGCTACSDVRYCSNACRLVHAHNHAGSCGSRPLVRSYEDLTDKQKLLPAPINPAGNDTSEANGRSRPIPHHDKYRQRAFSMHCQSGAFPPLVATWIGNQQLSGQQIIEMAPYIDESKKKTGEYFVFKSLTSSEGDELFSPDATVLFTISFFPDDPRKKALKQTLNALYYTTGNSLPTWTVLSMELSQFAYRMILDVINGNEFGQHNVGGFSRLIIRTEFMMQFSSEFFFSAEMQSITGKFDFETEWSPIHRRLEQLVGAYPSLRPWF